MKAFISMWNFAVFKKYCLSNMTYHSRYLCVNDQSINAFFYSSTHLFIYLPNEEPLCFMFLINTINSTKCPVPLQLESAQTMQPYPLGLNQYYLNVFINGVSTDHTSRLCTETQSQKQKVTGKTHRGSQHQQDLMSMGSTKHVPGMMSLLKSDRRISGCRKTNNYRRRNMLRKAGKEQGVDF